MTRIVFSLLRSNSYFALDDISVRSNAAPGVELITNGGFEYGNLTGWTYCDQSNSSNPGGIKAQAANFTSGGYTFRSNSGSYFYVGGSTTISDYLSQTFPTTIGQMYTVSLYVINANNASAITSADLFLGV